MIGWFGRVLARARFLRLAVPDPSRIVPENAEHAETLRHADALLSEPRIVKLLNKRDAELRASFHRADRRLARR